MLSTFKNLIFITLPEVDTTFSFYKQEKPKLGDIKNFAMITQYYPILAKIWIHLCMFKFFVLKDIEVVTFYKCHHLFLCSQFCVCVCECELSWG